MDLYLDKIAKLVHGTLIGNKNIKIKSLSSIDDIIPGSLIFAEGTKNIDIARKSQASAIIVRYGITINEKSFIQVQCPILSFIRLIKYFYPNKKKITEIHKTVIIENNVFIGNNVSIGPYSVIQENVKIGDNCTIHSHVNIGENVVIGSNTTIFPNVTIYKNSIIGSNVYIHASSVIGSDGFGYILRNGKYVKIPHVGIVIIEDNVEIGANTTIDRATIGKTIIGNGTKIDNFVHIAHSVQLGKNNILCAFTGIAGSTKSGNNVIFAANVGVSDHVTIEKNVILGARSGVPPKKILKEGKIYLGNPARIKEKTYEQFKNINRISSILKKIKTLTNTIQKISKHLKNNKSN